jgi:hypothetical protein
MAYLEINNVSKIFGKDSAAVEDFNLQVEPGELVSFPVQAVAVRQPPCAVSLGLRCLIKVALSFKARM